MKEENQKRVENIVKAYSSINAERYARNNPPADLFDRIRDKEFLTVFSNLNLDELSSNKSNALDVGVRGGRYTMYLTNNGIETVGIDTAIIPRKYASERVDAKFIQASAIDLPFKKESFDLVICIGLLHHFEEEVLEKALEEISSVIKPGGIFVFDVKNKLNPYLWHRYKKRDRVGFTLKTRTTKQMTKLIEKHGFEVITKRGIFFLITLFAPFVVVFVRRKEI